MESHPRGGGGSNLYSLSDPGPVGTQKKFPAKLEKLFRHPIKPTRTAGLGPSGVENGAAEMPSGQVECRPRSSKENAAKFGAGGG